MQGKKKVCFTPKKDEKGNFLYQEATIKASEFSYLKLLDLFFRPQESFGEEQFDKIFPEKPNYQKNHEMIHKTVAFCREMNINSAVLLEDMAGFCRNINSKTRIPNDSLIISPNAGAKYPH